MRRAQRTQLFYKSLPRRSRVLLDVAIFCLFAPIGVTTDILLFGDRDWLVLGLLVMTAGATAVSYARAGFTRKYAVYIPVGIGVQVLLMWTLRRMTQDYHGLVALSPRDVEQLRERIQIDVTLLIALIAAGYALLVSVFTREGARYFATSTEIRLAQRIHDRLVPALNGRGLHVEWAGASRPSGDIGGDLVDVVEGPGGLVGCVADVSGHGVGAGLLMGMFKTAFRSSLARVSDPAELLAEIHIALSPLTEANMFVTAAMVRVSRGFLQFAGAGHPPMLVYRRATGQIEQIASTGPAVALLDDFSCSNVDLPFAPGDVALLVTDGILEALDTKDREVGLEPVSRALAANAGRPLADLLAHINTLAGVGTRADDQTILAIRAL